MEKRIIKQMERFVGYGLNCEYGKRTFPVIDGIAYTDSFSWIKGDYEVRFNGSHNGCYWNEIIVGDCDLEEITIEGDWGSEELLEELEELKDYYKSMQLGKGLDNIAITSKKIEDFSVNYANPSDKLRGEEIVLRTTFAPYIRSILNIDYSRGGVDVW